jgi:hypothetical protein
MSFFLNESKQVNAGVKLVEILPADEAFLFDYKPNNTYAIVYPFTRKRFKPVKYSPNTVKLQDNSDDTPNGTIFKFNLEMLLSSIDQDTYNTLSVNHNNKFFVKIHTDRAVLLFADMILRTRIIHPGSIATFSGFKITFASETSIPLLFTSDDPQPDR